MMTDTHSPSEPTTQAQATPSQTGRIKVNTENILPIIKKWLYSEQEIFIRELVSNAVDAIKKLRMLATTEDLGFELPNPEIRITLDSSGKKIFIADNGLGMTAAEVEKYIAEIAFSGAEDFIKKYDQQNAKDQIIGHFGLGFYSAYMVAKTVEIQTLSYRKDAQAVKWLCDGSSEYTIENGVRQEVGTTIILHLNDESAEFLEETKIRTLLNKFCSFMPFPIFLGAEKINNEKPIWIEQPASLKEEDYKNFYRFLYPFEAEPLFWIHMNIDYPFNLKGVLYFPKLKHVLNSDKGSIKLYCNQVFVSDDCSAIVPEWLKNLRGVIDSSDIPLNVSRSYLQADKNVRQLTQHIQKKIADKLVGMYNTEREKYDSLWEDINAFIKFGMMENEKFYDLMKEHIIFKSTTGNTTTIKDYLERNKEKNANKVFYANKEDENSKYLELFKAQGIEVLYFDSFVDMHFTQVLEYKTPDVQFRRIDSDIAEHLIDDNKASELVDPHTNKSLSEVLKDLFKNSLKSLFEQDVNVESKSFKSSELSAMIVLPEHERRYNDMQAVANRTANESVNNHKLVVNTNNPLIKNIQKLNESSQNAELVKMMCAHVYDLAKLAHKNLDAKETKNFVDRSNQILEKLSSSQV